MTYRKQIITEGRFGGARAEVYAADGRCVGHRIFMPFFETNRTIEKALRKAHAWADERIRICQEHEVIEQQPVTESVTDEPQE